MFKLIIFKFYRLKALILSILIFLVFLKNIKNKNDLRWNSNNGIFV